MPYLRRTVATLALTVIGFGAGAAFTTSVSAQTVTNLNNNVPHHLRGEHGSRNDIHRDERRLRRLVADLNRDRHDYGGHRASAVNLLQQAESQLQQAVQYDNAHPNE